MRPHINSVLLPGDVRAVDSGTIHGSSLLFAEQKRIVARLEEILPLCERLRVSSGTLIS